MSDTPRLLFVCVHNAGRSQMAAAYARHLSGGRVTVRSAGSQPADALNPAVVEAMAEEGIDISGEVPHQLWFDSVRSSDVVVTMGCGDVCPFYADVRYEDWALSDPHGLPVEQVRPIRDEVRSRVCDLLDRLGVEHA